MVDIIIKDIEPKGQTRSKIEKELIKEGWGSSIDEGQIHQCEFLERKAKKILGGDSGQIRTTSIDKVK